MGVFKNTREINDRINHGLRAPTVAGSYVMAQASMTLPIVVLELLAPIGSYLVRKPYRVFYLGVFLVAVVIFSTPLRGSLLEQRHYPMLLLMQTLFMMGMRAQDWQRRDPFNLMGSWGFVWFFGTLATLGLYWYLAPYVLGVDRSFADIVLHPAGIWLYAGLAFVLGRAFVWMRMYLYALDVATAYSGLPRQSKAFDQYWFEAYRLMRVGLTGKWLRWEVGTLAIVILVITMFEVLGSWGAPYTAFYWLSVEGAFGDLASIAFQHVRAFTLDVVSRLAVGFEWLKAKF